MQVFVFNIYCFLLLCQKFNSPLFRRIYRIGSRAHLRSIETPAKITVTRLSGTDKIGRRQESEASRVNFQTLIQ